MSAARWAGALAGVFALQAAIVAPAFADMRVSAGCIGGWGSGNCILTVRRGPVGPAGIYKVEEPRGEELEAAMERDRKWLARCKPVIRQDAYGVGRYHYAASGCEFGKLDDN